MIQNLRLTPEEEPHREAVGRRIIDKIIENGHDDRYATTHYPRNKDEWWANVDMWWPELLSLIHMYHTGKVELSAVVLERMRRDRDSELSSILETTWAAAPDHGGIHANKGWDVLCDLCSESYVLNPEEMEQA